MPNVHAAVEWAATEFSKPWTFERTYRSGFCETTCNITLLAPDDRIVGTRGLAVLRQDAPRLVTAEFLGLWLAVQPSITLRVERAKIRTPEAQGPDGHSSSEERDMCGSRRRRPPLARLRQFAPEP